MSENWGYGETNGPKTWHDHFEIASKGTRQSPVNICRKETKHNEALSSSRLKVNYKPEENMVVSNTGHSIKAQMKSKSEIEGGPLPQNSKYRLEQFHLHWGSETGKGSEHTIDEKAFDAELHLVHWDCTKYSSFQEAASKKDGLAVFGFLIKVGAQNNDFLATDSINKVKENGTTTVIPKFDPSGFVREKDVSKYYTYQGSLTTPPLFESVIWIVFERIMELSDVQLGALRKLKFKDDAGDMVNNYRPPCPLGAREVQCSF